MIIVWSKKWSFSLGSHIETMFVVISNSRSSNYAKFFCYVSGNATKNTLRISLSRAKSVVQGRALSGWSDLDHFHFLVTFKIILLTVKHVSYEFTWVYPSSELSIMRPPRSSNNCKGLFVQGSTKRILR